MSGTVASEVALLKRPGFVDRIDETRSLKDALRRAKNGEGAAWLLEGPEGIGKTRIARWLEELARTEGFEVRWGYGVREGLTPLLPFDLLFRAPRRERPATPVPTDPSAPKPPVLLIEEGRPRRFWNRVEQLCKETTVLVATRERPAGLRTNRPGLSAARSLLWITRLEGPEHINPASLDALADLLAEHLHSAPGACAAIEGIEYLVSQGSFLPVLRLLQFLRDLAQESGGQVLVALNPAALESREVSLLEAESEVEGEGEGPKEDAEPVRALSPTATLMRLLEEVEESAQRAPQLLVIDDLQWADAASVRALQFLVRNTRDQRVLWLGCLRSAPAGDRPGGAPETPGLPGTLGEIRAHMESEGVLQCLTIKPLPPEEVRKLLTGSTEVPLDLAAGDPGFQEFLGRTGGNPQFALSALRLIWEQGRIRHQGDRAVIVAAPGSAETLSAALPGSLRGASEERLGLLSPEERRFLTSAALLGKDFDLPPIAPLLGKDRDGIRAIARRLEALHGMIRPVLGGEDRWTFQDGTAWEVALSSLSPSERKGDSQALGRWWSEFRPQDVEGTARLLYGSGDAALALPWVKKALEHALDLQNAEAAERALQWTRELSASDPASVAERAAQEIAAARSLRRFGANRAALRVLRGLQPLELPAQVRRERELALVDTLAELDSEEAWQHAHLLEQDLGSPAGAEVPAIFRARFATTRAYLFRSEGHYGEARTSAESALQLLPATGEEREVARAHFEVGWSSLELEEWAEAESHFLKALELAKAEHLTPVQSAALAGLASLNYLLGDLTAARRYFEEGMEVERAVGELQRTISMLVNLADLAISRGDLEQARGYQEEAARLAERFDLAHWRAGATALKGDILARERRWEAAKEAYDMATAQVKDARRKLSYWQTKIGEAWVRGELGDPQGALLSLDPHLEGPTAVPAQYADYFHQVRGRLRELSNQSASARAELEAARQRTGPSPNRQARVLGDLASWEHLHGNAQRSEELRKVADRLYTSSGVDPRRARSVNELFFRESAEGGAPSALPLPAP